MIPETAGALSGVQPAGTGPRLKADTPAKIHDAAQQFEALLLTQILRSARESDGGWLGLGTDSASDCASDMADEQLALALSQRGGLGLADLIAAGLAKGEPDSGH